MLAFLFAVLTISFKANQVAVGLALSIFGTGLSAFIGKPYVGQTIVLGAVGTERRARQAPARRPALFGQFIRWSGSPGCCSRAIWWFLYRTHAGLVLRAVGESPRSAHALGYPVVRIRYLATLFGGAMAGVGGAYISLVYTPLWAEGMVAGRGWIAVGARRVRDLAARAAACSAPTCSAASPSRSCSRRARARACRPS